MNRIVAVAPFTLLALAAPAAAQTPGSMDVPPPPPMQVTPDTSVPGRPDGFSIGIGLGYDLPTDLQAPNITSVRFRFPTGLTVEPFVALAFAASSQDDGTFDTKTNTIGLELGADLRYPRKIRGPVDLVLIGGGGLGFDRTNPEGGNNNSSTFFIDLHWGFGLEYWVKRNWVISLSATNPLLRSTRQSQESGVGDTEMSTTSIGAIFEPNVTGMLHLFF